MRATMRSIYGVSQPDAIGTVFIADTGNAVVRAVNAALVISTVAGNGTSGYFGEFSRLCHTSYSTALS